MYVGIAPCKVAAHCWLQAVQPGNTNAILVTQLRDVRRIRIVSAPTFIAPSGQLVTHHGFLITAVGNNVFLLQVNSSPTMEASTPITTRLCAEVQVSVTGNGECWWVFV